MLWELTSKTSYVSLSQLQLGVFDMISNFIVDRRVSILIYEFMNIIPSKNTLLGCNRINKARLRSSEDDSSESIKNQRKIRCRKAKQKDCKNE